MVGVPCVPVTLWVGEFVTLWGGVKVTRDSALSGGGDVRRGPSGAPHSAGLRGDNHPPPARRGRVRRA